MASEEAIRLSLISCTNLGHEKKHKTSGISSNRTPASFGTIGWAKATVAAARFQLIHQKAPNNY